MTTPTAAHRAVPSEFEGVRFVVGARMELDNIEVHLSPDGVLDCGFIQRGGSFDVPTLERYLALTAAVFPDQPGYATWRIRATRPTYALRERVRDMSTEELRLRHVALSVGPVGRMIFGFLIRVVGMSVSVSLHDDEEQARAAVLQRMRADAYVAPWLDS